jgi:HSP20 family protein
MSKKGSKKKAKKEKPSIAPALYMDHDEKDYYIQVELPGVKKADVSLEVSDQSFCVRGSRADLEFSGCYILAHVVDTGKARAKFDNGLLSIEIPIKKIIAGKKVAIE